MIEVYSLFIPDVLPPPSLYDTCMAGLPENMRVKNGRYREWKDRYLHLGGLLLLQAALQKRGYGTDCLQHIRHDEYGRPFIAGDIDFNISHSGKYVVCAIGRQVKLGIDIEEISDIDFDDYRDVMSSVQWRTIMQSARPAAIFIQYWTIKESIIKADGRGLTIPLDRIEFENNFACLQGNSWYLAQLQIDAGHCATIASSKPIENLQLQRHELTSYHFEHIRQGC